MARVLMIKATPRDELSRSMRIARAFREAYEAANPDDTIELLDVFAEDIPEFDAMAAEGKYRVMRMQEHEGEEAERWRKVVETAEHFKGFDKYVIVTPMWNFSVPYRLKLYIDTIVQPGLTFAFDRATGYSGLVGDKPAAVLGTRGGNYAEGTGFEAYDAQMPYLRQILGFMGITNVQEVLGQPIDMATPEESEQTLLAAEAKAREVAAGF